MTTHKMLKKLRQSLEPKHKMNQLLVFILSFQSFQDPALLNSISFLVFIFSSKQNIVIMRNNERT